MTDNPYHNQHITEFTACMEEALNESNAYNDQQFAAIMEALTSLDERVSRLESMALPAENKQIPPTIEAEVVITRKSLKKLRDSIMNMFR